eukprot:TRINITY_DN13319_c0_g4_i1.p1 TRINITY_DN13319_c0_g4~~TRINITY_DN13319_c0_g4_i1.p1  ORF type:complete len:740 (+),score=110.38 TRINITY_DN13319_c0_g4_i1:46-2265(+)
MSGWWLLLAVSCVSLAWGGEEHQYCIVGGGPAGIQLGHFFLRAGRDYILFERAPRAGSFFEKYPRERRLISLNKRHVRKDKSAEFAFRHDWNSLIDERAASDRTKPVTSRSKELYPHADVLTEYLRDFAEEQSQHIRYNSTVANISRAKDKSTGFSMMVNTELVYCQEVILATGLSKPRGSNFTVDGLEHVEQYDNMPPIDESFEGKSVYVLGLGNAALETVEELRKYTSEVHLFSRSGGEGFRQAYETHYPGDPRAGRVGILDTYLLKSLDTFCFDCLPGGTKVLIIPCKGGRKCVWQETTQSCQDKECEESWKTGKQNLSMDLFVAVWPVGDPKEKLVRDKMKELGVKEDCFRIALDDRKTLLTHGEIPKWEIEERFKDAGDSSSKIEELQEETKYWQKMSSNIDFSVFQEYWVEFSVQSVCLRENPELMDFIADVRQQGAHGNERFPMDHVIVAFGWVIDKSIFGQSLRDEVATIHKERFLNITPDFQVQNTSGNVVPGLYTAGALSHGFDYKVSSGGFIHGFRYTAKALFRHFEEKNFRVPWPYTAFKNLQPNFKPFPEEFLDKDACAATSTSTDGCRASASNSTSGLLEKLMRRINEASAPYQMREIMGDMVVFEKNAETGAWDARYMEDVVTVAAHTKYKASPRLAWMFRIGKEGYGREVIGPERIGAKEFRAAHMSTHIHPRIAFCKAGQSGAAKTHYLKEDIYTSWESDEDRVPLGNFLNQVVKVLMNETA